MMGAAGHRAAAGRARGFTMLELCVVLLIIAVVAGLAAARYGSAVCRYRVDSAARHIVADLALARSKARLASQSQTVVFDVTANSLRLVNVPDIDRPTASYEVHLGDAPYYAQLVSANFGGSSQVVFDGFGSPAFSGTVVISAGGFTKTVSLSQVTGRATVQSGVGLASTN